jgi:hypothetical protein
LPRGTACPRSAKPLFRQRAQLPRSIRNQSFFLLSRPALDLLFARDRVFFCPNALLTFPECLTLERPGWCLPFDTIAHALYEFVNLFCAITQVRLSILPQKDLA